MELHGGTLDTTAPEVTADKAPLMHAGHVVREFLIYLKANPMTETRLVDVSELPGPKASLINAFRLLIANERRMQQRAQLQKIGLFIAQFQPLEAETSTDDETQDPLASWIDDTGHGPASNEQSWLAAYRDQQELTDLFDLSARMAEQSAMAPQAGSDDGQQAETLAH